MINADIRTTDEVTKFPKNKKGFVTSVRWTEYTARWQETDKFGAGNGMGGRVPQNRPDQAGSRGGGGCGGAVRGPRNRHISPSSIAPIRAKCPCEKVHGRSPAW